MLSSARRGCWRDIAGGRSFLDRRVQFCFYLPLSRALSLVCGGGNLVSHVPRMLFSMLTTFLLAFQYRHCMSWALHPQQLPDFLSLSYFCQRGLFPACPVLITGNTVNFLAIQWTSMTPSSMRYNSHLRGGSHPSKFVLHQVCSLSPSLGFSLPHLYLFFCYYFRSNNY